MDIREATEADLDTLRFLAEEAWIPTYRPILSEEQLEYMFENWYSNSALSRQMMDGQCFRVAFQDSAAVGYASFSIKESGTAHLHKLYIIPGLQGTGLGRKLLARVEEEAQGLGAGVLNLNVNRYNPSKGFYDACGYRVIQEVDLPIGPYWMNDFVMQKVFG
jgi:ribosomal protein S18 acetylase RimI-like enzyme